MGCGTSQVDNNMQSKCKKNNKKFINEELQTQFINLFEVLDQNLTDNCLDQIQVIFQKFQTENDANFYKQIMNIFNTNFRYHTRVKQRKQNKLYSQQIADFECKFTSEFQALFFLNIQKDKLNQFDNSYEDYRLIKYNIDFNRIILIESYTRNWNGKKNDIIQLRYMQKLKDQNYQEFSVDFNKTNLKNLEVFESLQNGQLQNCFLQRNYKKFYQDDSKFYRQFFYEKMLYKSDIYLETLLDELDYSMCNYRQNIAKYMIEFLCTNYNNKDLLWFTYNQSAIRRIFEENLQILKNQIHLQYYQLTDLTKIQLCKFKLKNEQKITDKIEILLQQIHQDISNRQHRNKIATNNLDEDVDSSEYQDLFLNEQNNQNKKNSDVNNHSTQTSNHQKVKDKCNPNFKDFQKQTNLSKQFLQKSFDLQRAQSEQQLQTENFNLQQDKFLSKSQQQIQKEENGLDYDPNDLNKSFNFQSTYEDINPLFQIENKKKQQKKIIGIYDNGKLIDDLKDNIFFRTQSNNKFDQSQKKNKQRPKSEILLKNINNNLKSNIQSKQSLLKLQEL